VLVIDDDELIRHLVCLALADDGFAATSAADITTALQQVATMPPGVILLDLHLGEESGDEFVQRYRALPGPHAPLIVFTASDAPGAAAEMARLGAAGFLAKPFDLAHLVLLVTELTRTPN
jgi:two-component system response regulator AtoC